MLGWHLVRAGEDCKLDGGHTDDDEDDDEDDSDDDDDDSGDDDDEVNLQMLGISLIGAKGRAWLVSMWLQQPHTLHNTNTVVFVQ